MIHAENNKLYQQLLGQLHAAVEILPDKPEETLELTLNCLWLAAANDPVSVERAVNRPLPELNSEQEETLRGFIERRCANEPLAHITQRQNFAGIELLAGPAALVPRKETEILALAAKDVVGKVSNEAPLVVDVCTGCGNLALVVANEYPQARVYASDLSAEAIALAKSNVDYLGLSDRVEMRCGDLLEPFNEEAFLGRVDVLICNPPYISTAKVPAMPKEISEHEPALAFDGGPFGIKILQKIIAEAPKYLKSGGYLAFEVGLGQVPPLVRRLERNADYDQVETREDDQGEGRVIILRRS